MTRSAVALLMILLFTATGCQTLCAGRSASPPANATILDAQKLIKLHKYQDAADELEKAAQDNTDPSIASRAKYLLATVYVAADNPDRNYSRALDEFDEFLSLYPTHVLASEARNWHQALKSILEMRKENERLSKNIERLKQLDVRQEEKRLGR